VGYQAEGTLGRSIVNGDKDVSIFGEKIHVNAEICNLEGFSGHADRDDLLDWLGSFLKPPKKIFLVHGEEGSKKGFAASVKEAYGYNCTVVEDVSEFNLDSDTLLSIEDTKDKVATQQQLTDVRNQLSKIHDELESILYNADLAVGNGATQDKINEINNIILELDKSSLKLGSAVAKNVV
jgi:metallo-beta-lactamase family protein